jgi:hypothetical protein
VVRPDTGKVIKWHVNNLWPEMAMIIRNRSANSLVPQLAGQPFADWNVNERYCDGSHLTPAVVAGHLAAARDVVGLLEQAHIDGVLR